MALGEYPVVESCPSSRTSPCSSQNAGRRALIQWWSAKPKLKPNSGRSKNGSVRPRTALRRSLASGGNGGLPANLRVMPITSCGVWKPTSSRRLATSSSTTCHGCRHSEADACNRGSRCKRRCKARARDDWADLSICDCPRYSQPKSCRRFQTQRHSGRCQRRELLLASMRRNCPICLLKMESYEGDALTRLAMRLMAYTFVRTSELIESEWSEFDLDNARWDIPAERMKMDTPHIVPLSRQSIAVLRALSLLTGNGRFVFPGANDKKKPMSNNTILFALYRLGLQRPHDRPRFSRTRVHDTARERL